MHNCRLPPRSYTRHDIWCLHACINVHLQIAEQLHRRRQCGEVTSMAAELHSSSVTSSMCGLVSTCAAS